MHKFSRTLLVAGVLAFGTLSAACGDKVTVAPGPTGVQLVTVTPSSAALKVGESIILSGQVTADAASAKTVTWTTSSAAVATVDATGKVTGVGAGTASITATSTADPSKAASSVITVTANIVVVPTIAINGVTQNGVAVNLGNTAGQIDVTVNTSGGGLIEVFVSTNCTSNAIGASDVLVASQTASSAQAGTVTLSFNTAQLKNGAPVFANGAYCIKTQLTNGATKVVATNTVPITLNNQNVFTGTLTFASQTGGPTSAVSTNNGLNYNQGTLTAKITPVIFTSASPVALISGSFTRNGEQAGGASPGAVAFTNVAVTNGVATIVLPDTAGAVAGSSIYQYTSLSGGDNLTVASATDAAGNPITIGTGVVTGAQGVRIDNDIPLDAGVTYTVTAPNGYIGAAYTFSSGTTNPALAVDTRGGVPGVGGVTITYYVGAAASTAFTTPNSCDVTGLTVGVTGSSLNNTQTTSADQAKVIIADALGNKVCRDVASTFAGGLFGVDKAIPVATMTTANNGAANATGYNVTKNFSFIYNDTISGFNPATPLTGTLTRNFFTPGVSSTTDCLLGTPNVTAKTCTAAPITVTSTFGVPPNAGGSIEFTNSTAVAGYYTVTATPVDRAGNVGAVVTRIAAFDAVAPAVGTLTQSPNPVAPLATVTVSGTATDLFDLASAKGHLIYATAPNPFQSVSAAAFEANFNNVYNTSQAVSIALPNVYRGLQSTVAGAIQTNAAVPTATVTALDVGTNPGVSPVLTIATTTAATNVFTTNTLTVTPTSAAPATTQASTTLTVNVGGLVADPAFQSRPFDHLDVYAVSGGELVLVANFPSSLNPTATDVGTARTYTYAVAGVPLTAAATNTLYVVGVTAAGDAVISGAVTVTNP